MSQESHAKGNKSPVYWGIFNPIRKNSYSMMSIGLVGFLTYFVLIKNFSLSGLVMVVAVAALLFLIWAQLKPGQFDIEAQHVFESVGNGRPTFLNVFSNT